MFINIKNQFCKNCWPAILLIIILTSIAYGRSLGNGFVWDDHSLIVDNDFVKSWSNFPLLFKRDYLTPLEELDYVKEMAIGSGELSSRPVGTFSFFIDYSLWQLNPFGYHLTNLIFHILNGILVYLFIYLIGKNRISALFTALLFTLHPVNTEAVNVISFREDLLALFFMLLSLIMYLSLKSLRGKKRVVFYITSNICYIFALFSKEMAITLPLIIILYDYCFSFKDNQKGKDFLIHLKTYYGGYIAISLLTLWVWFFPMARPTEFLGDPFGGNSYVKILTMIKVVVIYISWLFFPFNLHATLVDPAILVHSFIEPQFLISVIVLILSFILAVRMRKKAKSSFFAIIWFFSTLIPVLNIILMPNILANRFLYIPSVGFCFLLALLWQKIWVYHPRYLPTDFYQRIIIIVGGGLLLLYMSITFVRSYVWENDLTFQYEMLEYYPDHPRIYLAIGDTLQKHGAIDQAIIEYERAIALAPYLAEGYNNLGKIYAERNIFDKAVGQFKKAIALDPCLKLTHTNLCSVYGEQERYDQSIACFKDAIKNNPDFVQAYYNLGITYLKMGNRSETVKIWKKALEINPSYKPLKTDFKKLQRSTFKK